MTFGSPAPQCPLFSWLRGDPCSRGSSRSCSSCNCPGNVNGIFSWHCCGCCVTFRTPIHAVIVRIVDLWWTGVTVFALSVKMLCHCVSSPPRHSWVLCSHCLPLSCPHTLIYMHLIFHVFVHTHSPSHMRTKTHRHINTQATTTSSLISFQNTTDGGEENKVLKGNKTQQRWWQINRSCWSEILFNDTSHVRTEGLTWETSRTCLTLCFLLWRADEHQWRF